MDLQELEKQAREAFKEHGLAGWTFVFSKTKRQLGSCKYLTKRIEIAEYYARNSPDTTVLDTLYHEIAHALAGPSARHGPAWKAVAIRLGATPRACDTSNQAVIKPGDWQATCPSCSKVYHRYKRPRYLSGYRCRCPAQSSLLFHYTGDPATRPFVPLTLQDSAPWEAKCTGCNTSYFRMRKPKVGIWRCRCVHRCELTWRYRASQPGVQ